MAGNFPTLAQTQAPGAQPQPSVRQYEKLMKFGATKFKATVDPLEAEQWLERMERVFSFVSLLQGDTYEWWKTIPYSPVEPPVLT